MDIAMNEHIILINTWYIQSTSKYYFWLLSTKKPPSITSIDNNNLGILQASIVIGYYYHCTGYYWQHILTACPYMIGIIHIGN